jgi:holo-[acyl-carrier protein] synthase
MNPPPSGTTVYGIGIDLVETTRIATAIARPGFLNRCFTAEEQAYCGQSLNSAPSYAARWAAKEAVAKAFGTGIGADMSLLEIEVYKLPSGQPCIRLTGNAEAYAARLGVCEVKISLTHTKEHASAYAMILVSPVGP